MRKIYYKNFVDGRDVNGYSWDWLTKKEKDYYYDAFLEMAKREDRFHQFILLRSVADDSVYVDVDIYEW